MLIPIESFNQALPANAYASLDIMMIHKIIYAEIAIILG